MTKQWKSRMTYEHPAPYRKGQYGHIVRGAAGIFSYLFRGCRIACPQKWAQKMFDLESEIKPGRPEVGSVRLPAIAVRSEIAQRLEEKAAELGLTVPDARREAYEAFVRGDAE